MQFTSLLTHSQSITTQPLLSALSPNSSARKFICVRTEISLRADANEREHINPPTNEPARRALFGEDKPSGLKLMLSQKG